MIVSGWPQHGQRGCSIGCLVTRGSKKDHHNSLVALLVWLEGSHLVTVTTLWALGTIAKGLPMRVLLIVAILGTLAHPALAITSDECARLKSWAQQYLNNANEAQEKARILDIYNYYEHIKVYEDNIDLAFKISNIHLAFCTNRAPSDGMRF